MDYANRFYPGKRFGSGGVRMETYNLAASSVCVEMRISGVVFIQRDIQLKALPITFVIVRR